VNHKGAKSEKDHLPRRASEKNGSFCMPLVHPGPFADGYITPDIECISNVRGKIEEGWAQAKSGQLRTPMIGEYFNRLLERYTANLHYAEWQKLKIPDLLFPPLSLIM
jgi:hypothetical protein